MKRIEEVVCLRDAAVQILRKRGTRGSLGNTVFNEATPNSPYPRLSVSLNRFPPDGRFNLSVWAPRGDWYGKVLNIEWLDDHVELVSFRRGEWETNLLAIAALAQ
jgi:hypothetical protein